MGSPQESEEALGSMPTMPPLGGDSGGYPPPAPQVAYIIKPRAKWQTLRTIAVVLKVFSFPG